MKPTRETWIKKTQTSTLLKLEGTLLQIANNVKPLHYASMQWIHKRMDMTMSTMPSTQEMYSRTLSFRKRAKRKHIS